MCRRCGLIFISPRMTREGYDEYYKFHYRLDRNTVKGSSNETDLAANFAVARKFGQALARRFRKYWGEGLTVDVGSSTGGILAGLKAEVLALKIFGIEPSVTESNYANAHDVPTKTALFEDFKGGLLEPAANILCVQSLNHLLDPKRFLRWSFENLRDGGHIFLAVKNFRHQVRRAGAIEAGVQIDHVYMFTPETLKAMVESVGFKIVAFEVDEGEPQSVLRAQRAEGIPRHHIRLVARKNGNGLHLKASPLADLKGDAFKSGRIKWWKLRLSFWLPFVRLVYILKYSHRFSKVRRLFGLA